MPANTFPSSRVAWIDTARALCIILVVIGHAIFGFRDSGLIDEHSMLAQLVYYIYTMHMPAFFVLSGLMVHQSLAHGERLFAKHLLAKLVYPYFLWGIFQLLVLNLMGNLINHPTPSGPHQFLNLVWGNVSQFWFLKVLFLIHVLYLVLRRYLNDVSFLLICLVLRGCVELYPLPGTMAQFFSFAMFYAFGILYTRQASNWPSSMRTTLLWFIALSMAWLLFATIAWENSDPIIAGTQLRASLLPASIAGTLAVFAVSGFSCLHVKLLSYIGRHTLSIFLLHVLFVAGTRILCVKFFHITDVSFLLPCVTFAGLFCPLFCLRIADHFNLRKTLGLG